MPSNDYSSREQVGWYFYDFANSPFSSTVVTLFLGPYLTAIAKAGAAADGYIHPLGMTIDPRAYWGFLVSLSVVTQVLVLPLLGAFADYGQHKKRILGLLAYTGAAATMAMYFIEGANYLLGGALFLAANLAFGASIVVYNSFLPEIAAPADRDDVSSKGWGIGYIGGGVLLALNLVLFSNAAKLGITEGQAVRISLCSAGVWWALFTIIPLIRIRNRAPVKRMAPGGSYFRAGLRQLLHTVRSLKHYPQTVVFLIAYLVYNDAIQTVIALAAQFGSDELKLPMSSLTLAILMVQFVAFFGAIVFNYIAKWITAIRAVMLSLFIWTGICVYVYVSVKTEFEFFVMAALVALVMGGSQALSRSLYSLMIPKGQEAEYFSIYEISDKGTSWLGPLVFGLALQFTGNYRLAVMSLIVFFAFGLAVLSRVDVERASLEAQSR
jgi:UMF1 family MFS transporter